MTGLLMLTVEISIGRGKDPASWRIESKMTSSLWAGRYLRGRQEHLNWACPVYYTRLSPRGETSSRQRPETPNLHRRGKLRSTPLPSAKFPSSGPPPLILYLLLFSHSAHKGHSCQHVTVGSIRVQILGERCETGKKLVWVMGREGGWAPESRRRSPSSEFSVQRLVLERRTPAGS